MQLSKTMHSIIEKAYLDTHENWLSSRADADGYYNIDERKIGARLDKTDMKHVAAQFSVLFPTHYFKVMYSLENIIQKQTLLKWLKHNENLIVIDVGCGAGAASAAVIAVILDLLKEGILTKRINVFCIGVDLVTNSLGIYNHFLENIRDSASNLVNLNIRIIPHPVAASVTYIDEHLKQILNITGQPSLAHVLLMQVNIVRPLSKLFDDSKQQTSQLLDLGISQDTLIDEISFGYQEARAYHQLFTQAPIDNFHIFTVGTDDVELQNRVKDMGRSITEIFHEHEPSSLGEGLHTFFFENPLGSYWRKKRNIIDVEKDFYIHIASINNISWKRDSNWQQVTKIENLKLAWVRVRATLMKDVLRDEIEIRLFEKSLDENLFRLQKELVIYAKNVAKTDDRLQYLFPKNEFMGRPKVLSRMEEEILSVAIIQVLGQSFFNSQHKSYAYRPNPKSQNETEYLYEYWFEAYQRFNREVRASVEKHPASCVLRVDIESFFTRIHQQTLIQLVQGELRSLSKKIDWLLHKLLLVEIDNEHHHAEHGLTQGGVGSGFYANAYLTPIDNFFNNNSWEAELFRFVDDIVIVIPDPSDLTEIKASLEKELSKLNLNLNSKKEEVYQREDYLLIPDDDSTLAEISQRFKRLTNSLWYLNYTYHRLGNKDWWSFIERYRQKLETVGFYVSSDRLSRKVAQYIDRKKRNRDLKAEKLKVLDFPSIKLLKDDYSNDWALRFVTYNSDWWVLRLQENIVELLIKSYQDLATETNPKTIRILSTRVYFCANRLTRLGFTNETVTIISEILINQPWIIRQSQHILRSLAYQGYKDELLLIAKHYIVSNKPEKSYFLGMIIHSLRFAAELSTSDTEFIFSVATTNNFSLLERIMATETLLFLDNYNAGGFLDKIASLLRLETNHRLKKNFMLLLGKHSDNNFFDLSEYAELDDNMFNNAYQTIVNNEMEEMFEQIEPDIIREQFYSVSYPDDADEFDELGY